jgi:DNA-binding transcriptional ArsR family regulator
MPIPQALKPELLRILNDLPGEAWANNLWRRTLYKELGAGRCTEEEVSAFENESLSVIKQAVRGVFDDIPSRCDEKRPAPHKRRARPKRVRQPRIIGIRYVRRHSLDPFVSNLISTGARATLLYLIARCGKGRAFKKQTCLVASDLGIAQRTVQAHYAALENAGYIVRGAVDPKTGATSIRLTEAVEPPPFKPTAEPLAPAHGSAAQESALTKPIKGESKTTYLQDTNFEGANPGLRSTGVPSSHEPRAEPSQPAQPGAHALGDEEVLNQAFRHNRELQRSSDRSETIGLTSFDQHLYAVLISIACKQADTDMDSNKYGRRSHLIRARSAQGTTLHSVDLTT